MSIYADDFCQVSRASFTSVRPRPVQALAARPIHRNSLLVLTFLTVDPWFNFRATKYLVKHGFYSFWDWFDDRPSSLYLQTYTSTDQIF